MSVQSIDDIIVGDSYLHDGETFIVSSKKRKKIGVMIGSIEAFVNIETFRFRFTKETPVKTWCDEPQKDKFYGICFASGTRFYFCPIEKDFITLDGRLMLKGDASCDMFYLGNGNLGNTLNNYEIIEFNNLRTLLKWLRN